MEWTNTNIVWTNNKISLNSGPFPATKYICSQNEQICPTNSRVWTKHKPFPVLACRREMAEFPNLFNKSMKITFSHTKSVFCPHDFCVCSCAILCLFENLSDKYFSFVFLSDKPLCLFAFGGQTQKMSTTRRKAGQSALFILCFVFLSDKSANDGKMTC